MERNVQGLEDLDERFDSAVKLLVGMGSHEREADQRIARSDSRSHDGIDEDTFLEEHSRHAEGLLIITDKEGDDRRRGITDLEAQLAEAIQAVAVFSRSDATRSGSRSMISRALEAAAVEAGVQLALKI